MVLAEKGTLDHAKDVFARVREVSAEVLGDVWINLAHVYLAQNKHNEVSPSSSFMFQGAESYGYFFTSSLNLHTTGLGEGHPCPGGPSYLYVVTTECVHA